MRLTTTGIPLVICVLCLQLAWWCDSVAGSCDDCPVHEHLTMKQSNESLETFVSRMFVNYRKHYRPRGDILPNSSTTGPVKVAVNMQIVSFSSINVLEMDYVVDILLRQRWYDYRLQYSGYDHRISLSYIKHQLWIPDLFFRNAKDGRLHTLTKENTLIWLNQSGYILFSQKVNVRLSCPMKLYAFPMDIQKCKMEIGSYGHSMEDLQFSWLSDNSSENVVWGEDLELNEYDRPVIQTKACEKKFLTTGSFSCIYSTFKLRRKFAFYLIYTYLPSILIVMISWVSFFIDYHAVPARISLCLLSILSVITQTSSTLQKLPPVSYVKAMDIWLFAVLAFVVISLLEYAVVNSLSRKVKCASNDQKMREMIREEMRSCLLQCQQEAVLLPLVSLKKNETHVNTQEEEESNFAAVKIVKSHRPSWWECFRKPIQPETVDTCAIVLFPLLFIGFNATYWGYLLLHTQ